ncbi:MAG TPA: VOC family protein [Acidimicrobiales bacterium]
MPSPIVLDHVAVAVERWGDAWPRFRRDLGGAWVAGGGMADFDACQLAFADLKVEVLAPAGPGFARRFLDAHGPGPHHLTFKVPDLAAAIAEAEAAGYPVVGVDVDDPMWKEAFLHPKAAHGVVVQLAQAAGGWDAPAPADLPAPAAAAPARLLRVALAVADPVAAAHLFAGVLRGDEVADGPGWLDLRWSGGGTVRLLDAAAYPDVAAWVGDRPGRVHHLAFAVPDPAAVPGAAPAGEGWWEVPPDAAVGTRLLLTG